MSKFKDNPWLGLESYHENQIIYGRNVEIRELSQCVLNNRETVLYGKSGIGKSSIINAGIMPVARTNGFIPVVIRLDHSNKYPYVKQINDQICKSLHISRCTFNKNIEELLLWEYFHTREFSKTDDVTHKQNLLIIFDQFEEIFTLQENHLAKIQFFKELADVLNDVMPKSLADVVQIDQNPNMSNSFDEKVQVSGFSEMTDFFTSIASQVINNEKRYIEDNEIHFVFTLREDFLSEFEYFTVRIPSLRQHRYGLRPINEEQAAEIILKPRPELVDENVARLIIETVTNRTDFTLGDEPEIDVDAAVLSLFLSQIYDKRESEKDLLSVDLVRAFGKDIINDFYEDAIAGLLPEQIDYLEEELLTGENRRDSLSRADFIAGGFTEVELKRLVEEKKLLRQFHYEGDLRVEFIHDVLCNVVKERKEKRAINRKQEEERLRLEAEKRKIQEEAELKQRELEKKAAEERTKLEAQALRIRNRNRRIYVTVASLFFAIAIGVMYYYFAHIFVYKTYYSDFIRINGWPVGVGSPLNDIEKQKKPIYYCLSHRGCKAPFLLLLGIGVDEYVNTDVEVMSSNKYLSEGCRIPALEWGNADINDNVGQRYDDILRSIVNIHYTADEDWKNVSKEDYYDGDGTLLLTRAYYHINSNEAYVLYMTPKGENMRIRSNGIDRVKISCDTKGRIVSMSYYDEKGVQKSINTASDITGYLWDYSKTDTIVRYELNQYGIPSDNKIDNTLYTITHGDTTITIHGNSSMVYQQPLNEVSCVDGYSRVIKSPNSQEFKLLDSSNSAIREFQFDEYGNILSIKTSGSSIFEFPEIVNYKYAHGRKILEEQLTSENKPYRGNPEGLFRWEYIYGDDGSIVEEKHYKYDNTLAYHYKKISVNKENLKINTTTRLDIKDSIPFVQRIDTVFTNGNKTISYYAENHRPINRGHSIGNDTMVVHRIVLTEGDKIKKQQFYIYRDSVVIPIPTLIQDDYLAKNYFSRIEEFDVDGNLVSLCLQDENSKIIKNMVYFYQNGTKIGRAAKSIIDGRPVRCDNWEEEGYCYYKLYYSKNYEDVYSAVQAVDEWNHRSSFFAGADYLFGENMSFKNESFVFDGNQMTFWNRYEQFCFDIDPEISDLGVPYVHVLSLESKLYDNGNGICDGDRIIMMGTWHIGMPISSFEQIWHDILGKSDDVECIILRPTVSGYKRCEYHLPIGKLESNYMEFHFLKLTNKEKEFILPCIK